MNEPPACRNLASALLPWYINGALGADRHAMVRDHVESCDTCAAEVAELEIVARSTALPPFTRESRHQPDSHSTPREAQGIRGWIVAVVLGVPAILGLVWVILGVARGR